MLLLGEVHTGLLQHSTALPVVDCDHLLNLAAGERVSRFMRPISWASSPDLLVGVDCQLPSASGARVRGVGTIRYRSVITGGHVIQAAAVAMVQRGTASRRLPWPHYLTRPGYVEAIGKCDPSDIAEGFLAGGTVGATLDLGGTCVRLMDDVQSQPRLDRRPPLRLRRTRLRWVASAFGGLGLPSAIRFDVQPDWRRTLHVTWSTGQAAMGELCRDVALHDWLLSAVMEVVERSRIGAEPRGHTVDRLIPVVDHLLHLWMPAARAERSVAALWDSIERHSGLSRQWRILVDRIRDQVALGTLAMANGCSRTRSGMR